MFSQGFISQVYQIASKNGAINIPERIELHWEFDQRLGNSQQELPTLAYYAAQLTMRGSFDAMSYVCDVLSPRYGIGVTQVECDCITKYSTKGECSVCL